MESQCDSQCDILWTPVPSISQLSPLSPKDFLREGVALDFPTSNSGFSSTAGMVQGVCAAAGSGDVGECFQNKSMPSKG